MKIIEIFSGTESISTVFRDRGWESLTIDNNPIFKADIVRDILSCGDKFPSCDVIWCSPPCTFFSVASIGKHWNKDHTPKSHQALIGLRILEKTIRIIANTNHRVWYIENPRGKMRKIIEPFFAKYNISFVRHTVTYCQYGDTRMKPTDIWTNNIKWKPKPICKNGDSCHVSAPRGSRTGTQGIKNITDKSRIPKLLCEEIFDCS